MELDDLLFDSSRKTADFAVDFIGCNHGLFKNVLDFALQDKSKFAMRASRVVCLAANRHPELIRPYINDLAAKLHTFKTDGLKRNVAKIISESSFAEHEEISGILIHTCFSWLNNPAEKSAVKVYAMDILYKATRYYPEIIPEFISTIRMQLPEATISVNSHGKKVLKKLLKGQL
jgi:hypothetical protein